MKSEIIWVYLSILGVVSLACYKFYAENPRFWIEIVIYAIAILIVLLIMAYCVYRIYYYAKNYDKRFPTPTKEDVKKQDNALLKVKINELNSWFSNISSCFNAPLGKKRKSLLEKYLNELLDFEGSLDKQYTTAKHEIAEKIKEQIMKDKRYLETQKKAEEVKINLEKGFFKASELNKDQIKMLVKNGYKKSNHVAIDTTSKTSFYLKPRANESAKHFFLVTNIANYLKCKGIDIQTPNSREADIIFTIANQEWAIEVETGSVKKKKPEEFKEKINRLNEKYADQWFIVLTDQKLLKNYTSPKYRAILRTNVIEKINKIIGAPK